MQAMLNHGPAAVADYRKVAALRPKDPNVLADLADLLAATGNGSLEGEPIQLVDRALAIDPNHVKALALKGSYAMSSAISAPRWMPGTRRSRWPSRATRSPSTCAGSWTRCARWRAARAAASGVGSGSLGVVPVASLRRDGAPRAPLSEGRGGRWAPGRARAQLRALRARTPPIECCVCTQLKPAPA